MSEVANKRICSLKLFFAGGRKTYTYDNCKNCDKNRNFNFAQFLKPRKVFSKELLFTSARVTSFTTSFTTLKTNCYLQKNQIKVISFNLIID